MERYHFEADCALNEDLGRNRQYILTSKSGQRAFKGQI